MTTVALTRGTLTGETAWNDWGTLSGAGLATPPMPAVRCQNPACRAPFPASSPLARFCSTRCRTAAWKAERKQAALVGALVDFFEVDERERRRLAAAVARAPDRFYRFAAWLGLSYRTKKYEWKRGVS